MSPRVLTQTHARRFAEDALGLRVAFPDLTDAITTLGYVQLDPINVCGRMHDLILRNRVSGYREGDLLRYTHPPAGERRLAFEHYLPGRGILVVFPMEAWPVIATVTTQRRQGGGAHWPSRHLSSAEEKLGERIRAELRDRGPLTSDDIEHEGRAITAWGTRGRLVKHVLEALFHRGEVLIAGRREFRRVYDLPERVIPASVRKCRLPSVDEALRAIVTFGLRQKRLVALPRRDRARVADLIEDVRLDTGAKLQVLREDHARLDRAAVQDASTDPVRLLAPLDPLIYDRSVTREVWGFDYTWEVYTPPTRRVRGYYALLVLSRGELVGHVEPRADREARRLRVVSRRMRRGHSTAQAVEELAEFLGLRPPA